MSGVRGARYSGGYKMNLTKGKREEEMPSFVHFFFHFSVLILEDKVKVMNQ